MNNIIDSKMQILIVVDPQNDKIDGILGSTNNENVTSNISKLIDNDNWDALIITQDTHYNNFIKTLEGKKRHFPHCIYQNYGWHINDKIMKSVRGKECFIERIQKSTMGSLDIIECIKNLIVKYYQLENCKSLYNNFCNGENIEITVCGYALNTSILSIVSIIRTAFPESKIIINKNNVCDIVTNLVPYTLELLKYQGCEIID